ncbi:hypothetical protein FPOAC2_00765 [Fusarium poae]|uniref:hypothetical protein n=1 Tax=Fusarium poae TaxID=36050 RepID=UPI001CE7AEA3|nr:hypothetical protein FPOAC1_000702 [Fusarium poae]KAG8674730.1 hypothetical protein FPOAC1_000702 [Fusarium poae]
MQTTDLPSWLWLPLKDDCEWDSPFNMGNCFDEQYHNVFFVMIKALIYLTRFTTLPFFLFFAGMHGECMATLPMAILSTITIIPMILLRLIWAEDYHTYGGMGNPMVEYSVKTWAILSMPNIVSWAPSAAFAVSQLVRIVRETFVSLRIQADSNFDAETLFPAPFAGRDWDSDLGESGAEAWIKKLVQEDQEERQARRQEEERVVAEQRRLEQASLLMQKLVDENEIAIWKAISKRRPQPILRRQSALTHRQETELLAEERGLSKKQFLTQRYVVVPVDQSTQSDPTDFADDRAMKTPVIPIAEIPPSPGVQSDLAESPVQTQVEPSEPALTGSSPSSPSLPSPRETTPKKPASSPATTTADAAVNTTTITPGRETPPVREPAPSTVSPRQEVVEAFSPPPSLPSPGVIGVVSSSRVVDEPIFPSEEELPPQAIVPFAEPAGHEPTQRPPSPKQAAGSATSYGHEIPGIPDIPEELLFTAANGSEDGREESLHQGLFQIAPCISPSWDPTELDVAIDALLNSVDEVDEQVWDEMAIDDRQVEDVEMEEQGEGEVEVLTSSQAVDCEMEEAGMEPLTEEEEEEQERMIQEASWEALAALLDEDEFCGKQSQMVIDHVAAPTQALSVPQFPLPEFHQRPPPQASIFRFEVSQQTVPADYGMSQQEQEDLEMEMEAAFDTEMEDARDEEDAGMGPQAPVEEIRHRRILIPRAQGSRHNPSQPPPQPTPTPSTTTEEVASQSKRARSPSTEQMAPEPKRAQHVPIQEAPSPTNASPKTAASSNTKNQQQAVAPILMGGLMLPGGNQITNTQPPAPIPAAAPSPTTITPEQKAAFEEKKQAQIKAQQEARRNKKPSLFHQSKKPATPVRPSPNTPHRQGTPSQPNTPSPMPRIKDGSVRAAAEAIFGTPGSSQKKDGLKILPGIPSHLRDQVAGRTTEDEDEE